MILYNSEIFWYDELRVGPNDNEGVIRCESIQIDDLTGPPEYRLANTESWELLTADGSNWRFETTRPAGSYILEIRDSVELSVATILLAIMALFPIPVTTTRPSER